MVKISVDEATAFDMYSILSLKIQDKGSRNKYLDMSEELVTSIGKVLCEEIISSNEYRNLCNANETIFELVDLMNSGTDLSALYVHECNMKRYTAKKDLQRKFFKYGLTERKI